MQENNNTNKFENQENEAVSRRGFITKTLLVGAGLAAGSFSLAASKNQANAQNSDQKKQQKNEPANNTKIAAGSAPGRRRLGKLEVSAVGLGVQNMSRKY